MSDDILDLAERFPELREPCRWCLAGEQYQAVKAIPHKGCDGQRGWMPVWSLERGLEAGKPWGMGVGWWRTAGEYVAEWYEGDKHLWTGGDNSASAALQAALRAIKEVPSARP